jgi:hypothetical protein
LPNKKRCLKQAENGLKCEFWHFDENARIQKLENGLYEVICVQKSSE